MSQNNIISLFTGLFKVRIDILELYLIMIYSNFLWFEYNNFNILQHAVMILKNHIDIPAIRNYENRKRWDFQTVITNL